MWSERDKHRERIKCKHQEHCVLQCVSTCSLYYNAQLGRQEASLLWTLLLERHPISLSLHQTRSYTQMENMSWCWSIAEVQTGPLDTSILVHSVAPVPLDTHPHTDNIAEFRIHGRGKFSIYLLREKQILMSLSLNNSNMF